MKTKTRLFSFYIFVDLFRKLNARADLERRSISSVLNQIVREYFEGKE